MSVVIAVISGCTLSTADNEDDPSLNLTPNSELTGVGNSSPDPASISETNTAENNKSVTERKPEVADEDVFDEHEIGISEEVSVVVEIPTLDWNPAEDCFIERIAVGGRHACAITKQGHVYCWGHDESRQLGVSVVDDTCAVGWESMSCSRTPLPVPGLSGIVDLALSNTTSCALDGAGVVWCWGYSQSKVFDASSSKLCDLSWADDSVQENSSCSPFPTPIDGIEHAVSIGAWGVHCAAELEGAVKCWVAHMGLTPTEVADVTDAVQTDFTCSITSSGSVQCWWCNDYGQRGDGTLGPPQEVGVPSNCILSTSTVAWPGRAVQVSSGYNHACLVDDDGSLVCWGDNASGQLGVPNTGPRICNYGVACAPEPFRVPDFDNAIQVTAGIRSTCVLDGDGQVTCMGGYGRQSVSLPAPAVQVAARYSQTCAVLDDGRVFCWNGEYESAIGMEGEIIPTEVSMC